MSHVKKEIRTEIVIKASPAIVWSVLTDFEKYPSWNPFIKWIKGEAIEGSTITARIEPPNASGMTFKPVVLKVNSQKEFRWLGHLFIPGLFDGEHIFELYENSDGSTTSATVTLGKRISRDFYVAYERSLAGTLGTFSIFYDLSRRFTLRARTGEQSAIDLIFTVPYD